MSLQWQQHFFGFCGQPGMHGIPFVVEVDAKTFFAYRAGLSAGRPCRMCGNVLESEGFFVGRAFSPVAGWPLVCSLPCATRYVEETEA